MDWAAISAIIGGLSLFSSLFGSNETGAQQTTKTEETPRGYQSSMLPFMDPMVGGLLASLTKDYSGAGMPGGKSNTQGMFGSLDQMIRMIQGGLGKAMTPKTNKSAYDTLSA